MVESSSLEAKDVREGSGSTRPSLEQFAGMTPEPGSVRALAAHLVELQGLLLEAHEQEVGRWQHANAKLQREVEVLRGASASASLSLLEDRSPWDEDLRSSTPSRPLTVNSHDTTVLEFGAAVSRLAPPVKPKSGWEQDEEEAEVPSEEWLVAEQEPFSLSGVAAEATPKKPAGTRQRSSSPSSRGSCGIGSGSLGEESHWTVGKGPWPPPAVAEGSPLAPQLCSSAADQGRVPRGASAERVQCSDSEQDAEKKARRMDSAASLASMSAKSAGESGDDKYVPFNFTDSGVWSQTNRPWMRRTESKMFNSTDAGPRAHVGANDTLATVNDAAQSSCTTMDVAPNGGARQYLMSDIVGFGWFVRRTQTRNRMTLNDALRGANMRIKRNRWVINPEGSKFLQHWDQVTVVALAFVAVVTPVQVAMMDTRLDALFFVNVVVDIVFFFDMLLQFFLMYPMDTNYGTAWEHRHSMIVKNYLKGWFVIDLASIVPFDLISVVSDSDQLQKAKAVKAIRLLRLLKLARMCKVSRLIRRLEMRMAIAYQRLALAKFLTMLILVTHWMANLWALTLILVEEDEGVPRWVDSFTALETNIELKTKDSIWKLYITCLYFTSYTITSVGYGDIGPANIVERIVSTLMIFASGITWALLIAQVCSIVSSMDSEEQNFRKIMDDLNVMMEDRDLPTAMRRRLRSFFLSNKSAARHKRHSCIVESMSPQLRGQVCLEMSRKWIKKISFFNSFLQETENDLDEAMKMQNFMVDVSRSLKSHVYAQGEPFGHAQSLHILNRGLASHTGKVRNSGSVWGTDFVLSNKELLEPYGSFALTYVEVTILSRYNFMKMVELHKRDCPTISKIVRRYCGWLALQRMILLEAQRRKRAIMTPTRGLSFSKSASGEKLRPAC